MTTSSVRPLAQSLTPARIGTIINLSPAGGGQEISIQLEAGRSLANGDILCVGIPVPESTDPPVFSVRGLTHRGRRLREVTGPEAVTFVVATLSRSMHIDAPVCRIFSACR